MSRIAYVNGRYLPHGEAAVHIEDRGYQFADGIYEVIAVASGRFVDEIGHLQRLDRSLSELRMEAPMARAAMRLVMREVVRRNKVRNGSLYMQISRGVAARDHGFPTRPTRPGTVMTAKPLSPDRHRAQVENGVAVTTMPDIRWGRCDIKSIALLPNCLAKQAARDAGSFEALLVDKDGMITEGSSTNAWLINQEGHLITRPAANDILNGITRLALRRLVAEEGLTLVERAFDVAEAKTAREVFITSSSSHVMPVVQVDEAVIGNGRPGSLTVRLREIYEDYMNGANRDAAATL